MTCPHLDYRDESAEHSFDVPRAYCTVVEEFVQPMRADVCNDRYDLHHAEHCEYFLAEAGDGSDETEVGDANDETEAGGANGAARNDGDAAGDTHGGAE